MQIFIKKREKKKKIKLVPNNRHPKKDKRKIKKNQKNASPTRNSNWKVDTF